MVHFKFIIPLFFIVFPIVSSACDLPSSEGRADLYGHTSSPSGIDKLNPSFRDGVAAMIDAAREEMGGEIQIYSGYRSIEHQQRLWDEAAVKYPDEEERDNWVARPGRSMHNFGLAVDLRYNGTRVANGTAISQWIDENASRFGLNRRMSNEPWHIEPIDVFNKKEALLAGADLECQENFDEMENDIEQFFLMPWSERQGAIGS